MKKRISFLLAAAMLLSLFAFVSCDEQTILDAADLALEIVENLPDQGEYETSSAKETIISPSDTITESAEASSLDENGWYDDKENVALYIHTYGRLPANYVSKEDAKERFDWEGGALDQYAEGMALGGSRFGNYEGVLPQKDGRQYYECDIDTVGKSVRGAKRIVYSNDGLIYYTEDHYETFVLLYGEE